jgi:Tol biopolymer transport system component
VHAVGHSARLSVCRASVALASALACLGFAGPVAEASFPGANGLLAVERFDPLRWDVTIWLVDPRTGGARELTRMPPRCRGPGPFWEDTDPSFSPSGRLIVYEHFDDCAPRTPDGIYVIRADGRARRRLPVSSLQSEPAFSPSGRRLASEFAGSIFITRLDRPKSERELSDPRPLFRQFSSPSWGASGRLALTVGASTGRVGHIATMTPDGVDLRLVTRSARDADPDWSPTADRIAFSRVKSPETIIHTGSDILVAPARAGRPQRPKRLTHTRGASDPVWSPDGRNIAFNQEIGFAKRRLAIMRASDGEQQRLLVNRLTPSGGISWQPLPRRTSSAFSNPDPDP